MYRAIKEDISRVRKKQLSRKLEFNFEIWCLYSHLFCSTFIEIIVGKVKYSIEMIRVTYYEVVDGLDVC